MIYAIGDIHGYSGALERALQLIERDGGPDAPIVFLGDYTDRGPDSAGVLDRLTDGLNAGRPWIPILGNHDRMFRRFVEAGIAHDGNIKSGKAWLHPALGGPATLQSYGVTDVERRPLAQVAADAAQAVPATHLDFLRRLPLWHEAGDLLFVHAGIRPGIPLHEQDEEDLIWIRNGWLEVTDPHPWLVVHGHTALEHPEAYPNRVNLDGGGGYGRPVWPAVFDGGDIFLLKEEGREPLLPRDPA